MRIFVEISLLWLPLNEICSKLYLLPVHCIKNAYLKAEVHTEKVENVYRAACLIYELKSWCSAKIFYRSYQPYQERCGCGSCRDWSRIRWYKLVSFFNFVKAYSSLLPYFNRTTVSRWKKKLIRFPLNNRLAFLPGLTVFEVQLEGKECAVVVVEKYFLHTFSTFPLTFYISLYGMTRWVDDDGDVYGVQWREDNFISAFEREFLIFSSFQSVVVVGGLKWRKFLGRKWKRGWGYETMLWKRSSLSLPPMPWCEVEQVQKLVMNIFTLILSLNPPSAARPSVIPPLRVWNEVEQGRGTNL